MATMKYPIGKRIKTLRETNKLTQEKLAGKAGISLRYLQNIEAGDRLPTLSVIEMIADALGISLSALFSTK